MARKKIDFNQFIDINERNESLPETIGTQSVGSRYVVSHGIAADEF